MLDAKELECLNSMFELALDGPDELGAEVWCDRARGAAEKDVSSVESLAEEPGNIERGPNEMCSSTSVTNVSGLS